MRTHQLLLAAAAVVAVPAFASAQTVDGMLDVDYGLPLSVQDTRTGFGNNTDSSATVATGSEIDGVFGNVSGGNLNLLVTGNLETNFNRLVLFFDTGAGGDNVVGTTPTASAGILGDFNGLTFDSGFTANNFLVVNGGQQPGGVLRRLRHDRRQPRLRRTDRWRQPNRDVHQRHHVRLRQQQHPRRPQRCHG